MPRKGQKHEFFDGKGPPPSALFDYPFIFGGEVSPVVRLKPKQGEQAQNLFREISQEWIDRPEWPAPQRNPAYAFRLVTARPVEPGEEEVRRNPRARSAKLRVIERIRYES